MQSQKGTEYTEMTRSKFRIRDLVSKFRKPTSGVMVILGFASLGDTVIEWRDWFSSGVLTHYKEVRDWIFAWVPFELHANFADFVVIWSSFGFLASWVLHDAERRKNPNNYDHISIVAVNTIVGFVFGPLVVIPLIFARYKETERRKMVVQPWEETEGNLEAALDMLHEMNKDTPAQKTALFHAIGYLAVGSLVLLFAASNFLHGW